MTDVNNFAVPVITFIPSTLTMLAQNIITVQQMLIPTTQIFYQPAGFTVTRRRISPKKKKDIWKDLEERLENE